MNEIAYQNKDITLKLLTEALKHKSLGVYGLPHIRIKDARPTNLPAVEANELRLDTRILKRFMGEHQGLPILHLIVIFSADISRYNFAA